MSAEELFKEGHLAEALAAQRLAVQAQPADAAGRLFLCELLLFQGELDAVRAELDLLPCEPEGMDDYLAAYHALLTAEAKRRRLLLDKDPQFLAEPPEHAALRLQAVDLLRRRSPEVLDKIDEADAAAPEIRGHVDGREFQGLRDGDDLFGSVLEVLREEDYLWIPFEAIRNLKLREAESSRDWLFVPADVKLKTGEELFVHLPALYLGSDQHPEEGIRLGLETDWYADEDGPTRGLGLRIWTLDEEELTPWEFRRWEIRR